MVAALVLDGGEQLADGRLGGLDARGIARPLVECLPGIQPCDHGALLHRDRPRSRRSARRPGTLNNMSTCSSSMLPLSRMTFSFRAFSLADQSAPATAKPATTTTSGDDLLLHRWLLNGSTKSWMVPVAVEIRAAL